MVIYCGMFRFLLQIRIKNLLEMNLEKDLTWCKKWFVLQIVLWNVITVCWHI